MNGPPVEIGADPRLAEGTDFVCRGLQFFTGLLLPEGLRV